MKIAIVNHSDLRGGAAVVSLRLAHSLQRAGVEVRMLVVDKQSGDPLVEAVGSKWGNKWNFAAERLGVFLRNGMNRSTLFKIDTATHGTDLTRHAWVREADVVCLNWVNQGMLSLGGIRRLGATGKPVVWTMHDMWNCTGVCHHSYECERYKEQCHSCPLLGKHGSRHDLSTAVQQRKRELYREFPIHFVAVSHWLAECCSRSSVMRDCAVSVIANAFPADDYMSERLTGGIAGLPGDKTVMVLGARRLDDEVKGFGHLLSLARHIARHKPQLAAKLHLALYGDIRDRGLLDAIELPHTYLGTVSAAELNRLYRHSDIVLSTSVCETLPGTLIEGQASGCLPVTFGRGGQADIVEHRKSGFIAQHGDAQSMAQGIEWAIDAGITREFLHNEVKRKFAAEKIAQHYITLFETLLRQKRR